jgi:hypothetical protein
MFRRVIEDIAPAWRRHLAMGDIPLFVELAQHGNIYLLEETMGVYRVHAGGTWSRLSEVEKARNGVAMCRAFCDHIDRKYRLALRRGLSHALYCQGLAEFTAGGPSATRQCLHEWLTLSGPLESLPGKANLAVKGYGWWIFSLWRQARRLWRNALRYYE